MIYSELSHMKYFNATSSGADYGLGTIGTCQGPPPAGGPPSDQKKRKSYDNRKKKMVLKMTRMGALQAISNFL